MSRSIPLTKGQQALVDDCDYELLLEIGSWCFSNSGYAVHYFKDAEGKRKTLYLHRMVYYLLQGNQHVPPRMQVDHINRDRLDNRRANLRLATRSQNQANKGVQANNKSSYKGVSLNSGKYEARIRFGGKRIHLGRYDEPLDAALMYDAATRLLNQEFANVNFPEQVTEPYVERQVRRRLNRLGLDTRNLVLR